MFHEYQIKLNKSIKQINNYISNCGRETEAACEALCDVWQLIAIKTAQESRAQLPEIPYAHVVHFHVSWAVDFYVVLKLDRIADDLPRVREEIQQSLFFFFREF
jgi:hypothetical protein